MSVQLQPRRTTADAESPTPPPPPLFFASAHGCSHGEEIVIDGQRVTWRTGSTATALLSPSSSSSSSSLPRSPPHPPSPPPPTHRVLRCFTHSSPILSTLFARFPSLSSPSVPLTSPPSTPPPSSPYLVLVHPDCLSIYSPHGDQFAVPLPFRVASAFPLLEGVLIQRTVHTASSASHAQPALFSLLHPLEEVRPLSRVDCGGMGEGEEEEEGPMMTDEDERVVWASEHHPLLVTYTHAAPAHRVYLIRQSSGQRSRRETAAGAEGDGRLLRSELLLHRCQGLEGWHTPCATTVFHASTADGQSLLCFCIDNGGGAVPQLCAFHLRPPTSSISSSSLHPAFTLPALSACRVAPLFSRSATPGPSLADESQNSDIAVLSPHDHSISIYHGQQALITLRTLALPSPPLYLSHPVGLCFTVHTAADSYRVQLSPALRSPLVHSCISALAYALPVQAMLGLKRDWMATREKQRTADEAGECLSSEWRAFAPLLLELLSPAPPSLSATSSPASQLSPPISPALLMSQMSASPSRKSSRHTRQISTSPPPPPAMHDDTWSLLLASEHHRQWSRHPLLSRLSTSAAILTPAPSSSAHDTKRQKTSATPSTPFSLSSRDLLQPHAAAILLALHLTCEALRLDELRHCHLHPLATLCHGLAVRLGAAEWCEAYQRDWPELNSRRPTGMGSSPPTSAALTSPPPSIFRWLHHRLSGDPRGQEPFPIPPTSLSDRHSPFELLRRVCECYELLTQPQLSRSSYAQPDEEERSRELDETTASSARPSAASPFTLRAHRRHASSRTSRTSPMSSTSTRSGRAITSETHPLLSPSRSSSVKPPPDRLPASSSPSAALSSVLRSFSATALSRLPFGVSAPLYQLLLDSRQEPLSALSPAALALIGRPELARMKLAQLASTRSSTASRPSLLELMETTAGRPQSPSQPLPVAGAAGEGATDADGTLLTLSLASFRFGSDLRLKQVRHLLRSTRLVSLALTRDRITEIEASNGSLDLQLEYQARLLLLARRILALPIARGMFTLSSFTPPVTTPFPIPPLTLSARLHPKPSVVELEATHLSFDFLDWPSFHNAAAAALRIRPTTAITSAFIAYNRPQTLSYAHAGWLYGLGLMGGLACLTTSELYGYLSQHHDGVTIGLLLGLSACKRGSMDVTVSKVLCLHIPALLPPHLNTEIGLLVKTAAVIGLGLLYQHSAHRLMTEVLLHTIHNRGEKETNRDKEQERSGYALAAGFGLGLVMLGRGGQAPGVSDLMVEDQLVMMLQGGWRGKQGEREGGALMGGEEGAGGERSQGNAKGGRGVLIDLDVTAPAATVALALMYLHSNNADIAAHLSIPHSHYEMDYVKADFLLLRSLARSLILVDDVRPTREWVEGQVPDVMKDNVRQMEQYEPWREEGGKGKMEEQKAIGMDDSVGEEHTTGGSDDEGEEGERGTGWGGSSEVIGQIDLDGLLLDGHGSAGPARRKAALVEDDDDEEGSDEEDGEDDDVDYEACRQGYCNIIAGSCLALGMQWAGTADASVWRVVAYYVRCFRAIRMQHKDSFSAAAFSQHPSPLHHLDRQTLETCLLSCTLALAMLMAGTGDLPTLRLLLSLQQRVDERHTVARQQASFMAIGLLFLGGGEWSLKRGKEGAVGLLLSMFPFFGGGAGTNENRLYLQALRHLYTLSAECRAMKAVEVHSGQESYCSLRVVMKEDGRVLQLTTPCLLPHIADIASVRVEDADYWPIEATFSSSTSSPPSSSTFTLPLSTSTPYILHVKRRSSHILRELDTPSFVELMGRIVEEREQREGVGLTAAVDPVTASTALMAGESQRMVQAACEREDVVTAYRWLVEGAEDEQAGLASLLLQRVRGDDLHALPLQLHLRRLLSASTPQLDPLTLHNLRLVQALELRLSTVGRGADEGGKSSLPSARLLSSDSVGLVLEHTHALLASASPPRLVQRYLHAGRSFSAAQSSSAARDVQLEGSANDEEAARMSAALLAWLDVPSVAELRAQLSALRSMVTSLERAPERVEQLLPIASMLFPSLSLQALHWLLQATC